MKKLMLAAAAMLATSGLAYANELKIAVFDAQEVLNGTNASKRAVQTLTSKRDAAQAKINALEKPLIDKQKQIQEQRAVMSPDKLQAAQADFAKALEKFRTDAQAVQADLDGENARLRKQISEAVRKVVEEVAKEKGYDLILPKGMVFHASGDVPDISAEVLTRANKALDK